LIEEIYLCVHHIGFSRDDVMKMPTYERRKHLELLGDEIERKKEVMEEARTNSKSGTSNGKRTSTISGEALKGKMQSGEIK